MASRLAGLATGCMYALWLATLVILLFAGLVRPPTEWVSVLSAISSALTCLLLALLLLVLAITRCTPGQDPSNSRVDNPDMLCSR